MNINKAAGRRKKSNLTGSPYTNLSPQEITPTTYQVVATKSVLLSCSGAWVVNGTPCDAVGFRPPTPPLPAGPHWPQGNGNEGSLVIYMCVNGTNTAMGYISNVAQQQFKNTGGTGTLAFGPNCDAGSYAYNGLVSTLSVNVAPVLTAKRSTRKKPAARKK